MQVNVHDCIASKESDRTLVFEWIKEGKFDEKGKRALGMGRGGLEAGKDNVFKLGRQVAEFREKCLIDAGKAHVIAEQATATRRRNMAQHQPLVRNISPSVVRVSHRVSIREQLDLTENNLTDEQHGDTLREMAAAAAKTSTAARSALKGAR